MVFSQVTFYKWYIFFMFLVCWIEYLIIIVLVFTLSVSCSMFVKCI
jgi:hypothetical protein